MDIGILDTLSKKELDDNAKRSVAYTCWYIWKGRCEVQLGGKVLDVNGGD